LDSIAHLLRRFVNLGGVSLGPLCFRWNLSQPVGHLTSRRLCHSAARRQRLSNWRSFFGQTD